MISFSFENGECDGWFAGLLRPEVERVPDQRVDQPAGDEGRAGLLRRDLGLRPTKFHSRSQSHSFGIVAILQSYLEEKSCQSTSCCGKIKINLWFSWFNHSFQNQPHLLSSNLFSQKIQCNFRRRCGYKIRNIFQLRKLENSREHAA